MQGYSVREIARMIGVARSTFYLMVTEGRAPRITKIGSRSIIFERDYLVWLDDQISH
jgi:predicted DNA-binding transcriptional regulator AlpA